LAFGAFAKRLRAYRKLKAMTQEEFARAMGVSVAIAGGWERGTRTPSEHQVHTMEVLFGATRQELGLEANDQGETM